MELEDDRRCRKPSGQEQKVNHCSHSDSNGMCAFAAWESQAPQQMDCEPHPHMPFSVSPSFTAEHMASYGRLGQSANILDLLSFQVRP